MARLATELEDQTAKRKAEKTETEARIRRLEETLAVSESARSRLQREKETLEAELASLEAEIKEARDTRKRHKGGKVPPNYLCHATWKTHAMMPVGRA